MGAYTNIMIFAVICDIFHNIAYQAAVTTSWGFYFEKEMHVELRWQRRQHALLFDEVLRSSQVNWRDAEMHAALQLTNMEDLL